MTHLFIIMLLVLPSSSLDGLNFLLQSSVISWSLSPRRVERTFQFSSVQFVSFTQNTTKSLYSNSIMSMLIVFFFF